MNQVNGLMISDRLENEFKSETRQHYQAGGRWPCHRARCKFFAGLKRDYEMVEIVPHLRDLYDWLDAAEAGVHEETQSLLDDGLAYSKEAA